MSDSNEISLSFHWGRLNSDRLEETDKYSRGDRIPPLYSMSFSSSDVMTRVNLHLLSVFEGVPTRFYGWESSVHLITINTVPWASKTLFVVPEIVPTAVSVLELFSRGTHPTCSMITDISIISQYFSLQSSSDSSLSFDIRHIERRKKVSAFILVCWKGICRNFWWNRNYRLWKVRIGPRKGADSERVQNVGKGYLAWHSERAITFSVLPFVY